MTYTWDTSGRVVGKGEWTFDYGPEGQLSHAHKPGRDVDFVYDDANGRLLKRVDGVPVRATVGGGVLTEDHFVELVTVAGVVAGVLDNGQFTTLLTDPRGTPFSGPDGTANLASPYGTRTSHLGLAEVIDYARLGWDPDLDVVRMGVRDYDAKLSQFLTPDPLYFEDLDKCQSSPLQCSLYGYAAGNPISFVDPSGSEVDVRGVFENWLGTWSARATEAHIALDTVTNSLRAEKGASWFAYQQDLFRGGNYAALGEAYALAASNAASADAQLASTSQVLSWIEGQAALDRAPSFGQVSAWAAQNTAAQQVAIDLGLTTLTAGYGTGYLGPGSRISWAPRTSAGGGRPSYVPRGPGWEPAIAASWPER